MSRWRDEGYPPDVDLVACGDERLTPWVLRTEVEDMNAEVMSLKDNENSRNMKFEIIHS
jgi:hypothetical protein